MLGNLTATPGCEDLFDQRIMDSGFRQFIGHPFYASKDNIYPTLSGGRRRINWGWANVGDGSAQSLQSPSRVRSPSMRSLAPSSRSVSSLLAPFVLLRLLCWPCVAVFPTVLR